MSFTVEKKNLDNLWVAANLALWNMADDEFDFVRSGVTAHSFHNQLCAHHADISMAISDFGYTKTKWSMLMRLYFNQESYVMLIERIKQYRNNPKGKRYVVDIPLSFKQRMNASGECLMGMTVRYSEKFGWECEVMTRASESVSRWGVDLVFIHVLLREIGKELDFTPHDVRVHWNSASMFQSILTVPLFICRQPGGEDLLKSNKPLKSEWQEAVRRRYKKSFEVSGQRKYSNYKSQQRVVKAYDALHGRVDPKHILTVDKLELPPITYQLPEDFFRKGGFK
jgi:hypothetical protein